VRGLEKNQKRAPVAAVLQLWTWTSQGLRLIAKQGVPGAKWSGGLLRPSGYEGEIAHYSKTTATDNSQ
jgi:hypothetical protein